MHLVQTIDPWLSLNKATKESVSLKVVTKIEEAERVAPEWEELLERSGNAEMTQTPSWLLTWWRVFGRVSGRNLLLCLFHSGSRLVGVAPLTARTKWYRAILPFRRIKFLGACEPTNDGVCSNHLTVIAERGFEKAIADQLVESIRNRDLGGWDEVVLPMMADDSPMPDLLASAFTDAGIDVEKTTHAVAPYVTLPSSWDTYLKNLPKSHRHKINRAIREFDEWSQGETTLECHTSAADIARAKEILIRLHENRWEKDGAPGVFGSPLFSAFHDQILKTLIERKQIEILVLRARGEPIAAEYNMVWNGKVYTYQSGRRTDLPEHLSPGRVLDAFAIRHAIEHGRHEFDFLADDAPYKRLFATGVRQLVQVRAARRTVREFLRRSAIDARRILSRIIGK